MAFFERKRRLSVNYCDYCDIIVSYIRSGMKKTNKKKSIYLSKSAFIRGLQCPKSLYLHKYHPEFRDELSEEQLARFRNGIEAGKKAQELFLGGIEIPYDEKDYDGQVLRTKAVMDAGHKIIYEATFSHSNVFVKVDILRKNKNSWEIYEAKSSAGVKEEHINDTALQYFVVSGAGIKVSKASVVFVNNNYVRDGEIEPAKLFNIEDVTDRAKDLQDFAGKEIGKLREMLATGMPDIDIGKHCEKPYECDFTGHCWQHIPEHSIFSLRGRGIDKFAFYKQGIIELEDVPLDKLNKGQRLQAESFQKKSEHIDKQTVREFLDTLWYPMSFLDFETISPLFPLFDGTRPYQKIPFQYSLHTLKKKGGKLQHSEFLAHPGNDFRKELLLKLLDEIPEGACVIAFNSSFEKAVLYSLADWFPEHKRRMDSLVINLRDLIVPFRKRSFYHYKMKGSYSIKSVLPVLVPELSYNSLSVRHGGMAVDAFSRMSEAKDPEEIERLRKALIEYCTLDTLAMVKILERLDRVVK